ncbi:MAG: Lipoprotein signal peptidase 2 [uncultured bacterium]|nr:MAG: Lipoprotein signal peptidase 2 [uncultured bacterium]
MKLNFMKLYYWCFISTLVFALDRITKIMVVKYLPFNNPVNIFPNFNLYFNYNAGSAFGFLSNVNGWQKWLFIAIALVASIILTIWQLKIQNQKDQAWLKIALALIVGGTMGNLYDRVVYTHVIDFLDFYFQQWHYATFNIADTAICVGAIMLLISSNNK